MFQELWTALQVAQFRKKSQSCCFKVFKTQTVELAQGSKAFRTVLSESLTDNVTPFSTGFFRKCDTKNWFWHFPNTCKWKQVKDYSFLKYLVLLRVSSTLVANGKCTFFLIHRINRSKQKAFFKFSKTDRLSLSNIQK